MPLDPQAKAFFDFIGLTQVAPLETLTPQEARARFETMAEIRRQMAVEPVDQVVRVGGESLSGEPCQYGIRRRLDRLGRGADWREQHYEGTSRQNYMSVHENTSP